MAAAEAFEAFFFYITQPDAGDLQQKILNFISRLPDDYRQQQEPEFVTFLQHVVKPQPFGADLRVSRGLLKLSLPRASQPASVVDALRAFLTDFEIHQPYQFATHVLLGNSRNLRDPGCGQAFTDTVYPRVLPVSPSPTFEDFLRQASDHVRNVFAHSTQEFFLGQGALYNASKNWCFFGTRLFVSVASPFWENSDILSYIFTATPYALFLPLCYERACSNMRQRRVIHTFTRDVTSVAPDSHFLSVNEDLPPFFFGQHDYTVTFNRNFGAHLRAGISYHVIKASIREDYKSSFLVARSRSASEPVPVAAEDFDSDPQKPVAIFQRCEDVLEDAAITQCMPAAQPAASMPSLLDAYFDYDMSLPQLMSQLGDGCTDEELFGDNPQPKKNQHEHPDFRARFAELRATFNDRIRLLADFYKRQWMDDGKAEDPHPNFAIWCKSYQMTHAAGEVVTFSISSSNWLGLSKVESVPNAISSHRHFLLDVRIPKAVKTQPCDDSRLLEFEQVMATLVPGNHIATASKQSCYKFSLGGPERSPRTPQHQEFRAERLEEYWLSEAGICTLEELFQDGVIVEERQTLAFRDLMRHVIYDATCNI